MARRDIPSESAALHDNTLSQQRLTLGTHLDGHRIEHSRCFQELNAYLRFVKPFCKRPVISPPANSRGDQDHKQKGSLQSKLRWFH
jgi:hypothetical protein